MKRLNLIYVVLAAMIVAACAEKEISIENQQVPVEPEVKAIVPGEAIVLFSDDFLELVEADLQSGSLVTKSSELNTMTEVLGIKSMERVFRHGGEFEARRRAHGLHKWYKITYDETIPVTKASGDLSQFPGIEAVEPVRNVRRTAIFDDPRLPKQWHYINDGTVGTDHKKGADINVLPVWENYTTGDPDVIVCVVDGGIDYEHEDLAAHYIKGYNFVRNSTKVVAHDHGTHVAGTIAAVNNNGIGVAGVAGGDYKNGIKGVGLLSAQIFETDPETGKDRSADGADAIAWGADNGAVISQNSWGYTYETDEDQAAATIPGHLKSAIDYFIKTAGCSDNEGKVQRPDSPMKGGVVIFATGNDARPDSPIAEYEPVIAVGSIGPDMTRAYYSNYGDWVDIAAPGGSVQNNQGEVLSTLPGNKYGYMQGTSMACPHVSGVAALIVSHFKGQGFTNETLRSKLINGANKSAISKNAKIGPLVDAFGAMTYGGTTPPKTVSGIKVTPRSNNLDLTWTVPSDPDDKKAYGFIIVASKDKSQIVNLNPASVPEGVSVATVMTEDAKVGAEMKGTLTGLEFEQDYHAGVVAFDYNRNYSPMSTVYTVTTENNNPPVVTTDYTGNFKVKSHETLTVLWTINDPDGHDIDIKMTPGSKAVTLANHPDGRHAMTIVGNADEPGTYKAVIKVTDSYGESTEKEISYELLPNHAPEVVKDIDDMLFDSEGVRLTIDMAEYLMDPDGEQLKFDITITDNTVLHINPSGNILNATTLSFGVTEVTIKASDSRGLSCTLKFKVLVKDPSKPVEAFPNPVKDWLTVSTMDEASTRISIVSSTGQSVYDVTAPVSAFDPALIDMSGCAPGMYKLSVEFEGQSYVKNIVKL